MSIKTISALLMAASAALAAPTPTTGGCASSTVELTGVTHTVTAGLGGLRFEPNNIFSQVGDVVEFHFLPANHSVVQSSFDDPCQPLAATPGFFSGFEFATQEG
jgi:plastocyanin